jgi:hypothetical protein
MLVSAPLLLWLAWSLAKPARKLKMPPMKSPRATCVSIRNWKPVRRSFCRRDQF